jgi:heterodisulfide reductase subunit A-like polyferredoxin
MKDNAQNNPDVVGAVMVVGGGIAGMQASLDLAESGYKVYLVEKKPAIGGHMAQLDKTFPTNDCAMCTISPKLVDCGRHRNIELLMDSDVLEARGEAGNFTVRVRTRPRYIDLEKCTGCGDCGEVCPVIIPGRFDEGMAVQHAAYKLYPQAVPNAFAIEKRGISPCRDACPAHQRAQGYIALIREGRYEDALRVIKEDNPFPGICGRICNHRCEDACNRGKLDDPINIHALKRFVTDKVYAQEHVPPEPTERVYKEKVAIIGAGPCGLTTAQDLCKLGYGVTVFEALPVAGGMLRVGVPEYRLPAWIVDREVQDIVDLGVELRLNTTVNNLDDLFAEGFNAVLIAVGAHEGRKLPIEGADLPGVLVNTLFLRDVRLGNPPDIAGKHVMVLGGGNVAIDVARTAVRLDAAEVHMACLESYEKMPAHRWEVEAAEAEGVHVHAARSFKRIVENEEGGVGGLECLDVTFMQFDETGRLTLETAPGSEHIIPCDTLVFSIGQRAGLAFIPDSAGVGVTRQQTIAVNPNTFAATRPGVFAAGDATTGTAFVIEAVAAGHQAAESIHRYLRGEELEPALKPELPVVDLSRAEIQERIERGEVKVTPRVAMPELAVEERVATFAEVETGYTDELAQEEAARCLACGICSECLSCWYECQAGAVNHDMVEQIRDIEVGAVVMAPGYEVFHAEHAQEYGWGRFPNVVTALQLERLMSASGPTQGHVLRPSDGEKPKKIAFLQCVGSRDQEHDYCSAVCCMYATKESIMIKEHEPDAEISVFMMDMRAFSKGYYEYYRRAEKRYGVRYVRSRVSVLRENPETHGLVVRYVDDGARERRSGGAEEQSPISNPQSPIREEEFDLVVLSVGMEIPQETRELARRLNVKVDEYGFCRTDMFQPLQTSRDGIFAVGPFREPKDIPESVIEGTGAAAAAGKLLAPARWMRTEEAEYPPEKDISREEARVGVFVCHCGSNIGGYLDVPEVAHYAASLPGVVHAEHNLYTCSQDSIKRITEQTKEHNLNRVVVASCTPLTHEPLFQDSIRQAGLNPGMFHMANIRNQCSWVHSAHWEEGTEKAKDLVRAAVAKAVQLQPIHMTEIPVQKAAVVIGGGVAGMTAALTLADQGFPVHLVERAERLGGNLWNIRHSLGWDADAQEIVWRDPQEEFLHQTIERVESHPQITLHLQSELLETGGFAGSFTSRIRTSPPLSSPPSGGIAPSAFPPMGGTAPSASPPLGGTEGGEIEVQHGATILAMGAVEYRGAEYGYGTDPRVVSQYEFEERLESGQDIPNSVVMIQCVGPAEKYCSRVCCTAAMTNALALKKLNPDAQITVLYTDVRTYGFKERYYQEARKQGVMFVQYDFDRKPKVEIRDSGLEIVVWEPSLGEEWVLTPDLLVLSMPMVPPEGAEEMATRLKVPQDMDGFFLEAHVKLRPVDFASDGLYMAGAAHYPKFIDESIAQAQAAAARAATILSKDVLEVGGVVAQVDQEKCVGCLTCVRICPYDVPQIKADFTGVGSIVGAATIEPAQCHGCGICVSECPAKAIQLLHYEDVQVGAEIEALLTPAVVEACE